jgi:hypothetical protein
MFTTRGMKKGVSWIRQTIRRMQRDMQNQNERHLSKFDRKSLNQMHTKRS